MGGWDARLGEPPRHYLPAAPSVPSRTSAAHRRPAQRRQRSRAAMRHGDQPRATRAAQRPRGTPRHLPPPPLPAKNETRATQPHAAYPSPQVLCGKAHKTSAPHPAA
ncbi:hypothetical protein NDU88_002896 [Pleurodeles waltl]|uniref:Uncharacterized protein n=1 Tax=Pleurodeles waltl TaxID=8319 RepID=A0AAV7QBC0_PLEWA|nr:hypothetical protein NDU88_002896 [Pleurodeles waltl]